MALGRARCMALVGLVGHPVQVEAYLTEGLPAFTLVGLPDTSLNESRDRVRAALANSRCPLPSRRITVNLSPADLPKSGSAFDLAIAAALLAACDRIPREAAGGVLHLGELGLDGSIRPVRGVLPAVLAAARAGHTRVMVAPANAVEARLVPGVQVVAVDRLADVIEVYRGGAPDVAEPPAPAAAPWRPPEPDLSDVIGQYMARHALEIAAAGGHHLLMIGPPGAGKSMLAARLPGLLPDLDDLQATEVTAIHSVAGTLDPAAGLIRRPPFEDPHHTATAVALIGGGSGLPRPGAASRAHRGVLFLDEVTEFERRSLETLRQPLESGTLTLHRALGSASYPARFQLVMAANPCPCGRSSGKGLDCTCTATARRKYLGRLSGPLLDRVDLQIEVPAVSRADLLAESAREGSADVRVRVAAARAAQAERFAARRWQTNAEVTPGWLRTICPLPRPVTAALDRQFDRGDLTMRGYDRVLRLAWTLADLGGRDRPGREDVEGAVLLRRQGRVVAA